MKKLLAVLLAASLISLTGGTVAQADTGWALYKPGSKVYVQWHTLRHNPPQWIKDKAVRRARWAHFRWSFERIARRQAWWHSCYRLGIVHNLIVKLFSRIGQVRNALAVAERESHCNPLADNPVSSAGGVFQYIYDTWRNVSTSVGLSGESRFNAYAAIVATYRWVRHHGWGHW